MSIKIEAETSGPTLYAARDNAYWLVEAALGRKPEPQDPMQPNWIWGTASLQVISSYRANGDVDLRLTEVIQPFTYREA